MVGIFSLTFAFVYLSAFGTCFPTGSTDNAEISALNSEPPQTVTNTSDGIRNTVTETVPKNVVHNVSEEATKTDSSSSSSLNSVSQTSQSSSTTVQKPASTSSISAKSSTFQNNILPVTSNETRTVTDSSIFKNETESFNGTHDDEGVRSYFLSKVMFWKDDFLSSIIAPVLVGLAAALLIITFIMCFKCFRHSLTNRKRIPKSRTLRGDIRKMKHIDRVKLLAASSDDEF